MYRSLISLMPKAEPLLLDLFPNAAVAYSLRKLRTAYTGPVVRVRRSVDNTEQDFLDTELNSTLTDWVGYNLWSYSEQMQQGVWAKTNTTSTTNTIIDPDGNLTGDVVLETSVTSTHSIQRTLSVVVGEEYTVSFWIKPEGRNFVRITPAVNMSTDNSSINAWLNLSNGTVVSTTGNFRVEPTIIPAANGWYFVTYGLIAQTTATSTTIQLNLSPDGSTTNYAGNTSLGVGLWGIQISETSTVKPYQKTEATAGGSGFVTTWYDQSTNGNNATQATAGNQPQIVSSGVILTDVTTGNYSVRFQNAGLNMTSSVTTVQQFIASFVIERVASASQWIVGNTSGNIYMLAINNVNVYLTNVGGGTATSLQTISGNVTRLLTINRNSSNIITAYNNGNAMANTRTSSGNTTYNALGARSVLSTDGYISEAIWWNQNYLTDRTTIETNINQHYNVY